MRRLPLEGVRILDLTMIAAGPYATQILADMGAEVIKIEGPTRYDRYRGTRRPRDSANYPQDGPGERPYNRAVRFNEVNRNKLGISLDLTKPKGVTLFKKLALISDVVMENYSPRVMKNFGLDYAVLRGINPQIIMVSMPGFGATGPYRDYVLNGAGAEAISGLQDLTGYIDGPPLKPAGWYGDQTNSLTAAFAVMAALHHRRRTGRGQHIESALREVLTPLIGEAIMEYTMNNRVPNRMGNRHPFMAPHGCYRCKGEDSWVAIAIRDDGEWQRFCRAIGNPSWCREERFAEAMGRQHYQEELDHLIEGWTLQHDHLEATHILQQAGVAAGALLDAGEVLYDPHLRERGYFQEVVHPEAGRAPLPRVAWNFSRTPCPIRRPAPCFGEHNSYIFGELLGLSNDDLDTLLRERAISHEPLV